ncbi:MAG TPA: sn-glycerol-3-phosphate ABC transporter ATP-binding protein UgpC [Gaiellaceae bacterium]
MAGITFDDVSKTYGDGFKAVTDLNLEVQDGEFVVFVGPSGCGKTPALRMIAGLEEITGGRVRLGDTVVNSLPPKDRDIAMVFQNYALYPHMSAYDNMAFGLKLRGVDKDEIRARVDGAAKILGLRDVLKKRPRTLSGGQRQRVAMGRAIVRQPAAFLMDEPLSNLDAKLRVQMRAEIARLQRDLNVTTIYVTHDQSEAMTLGDRVCVMRGGYLQQVDAPQVLYERPANLFVAEFIGSPAMNLVEAKLERGESGLVVSFGEAALRVPEEVAAARKGLGAYAGRTIALGIRPEDIEDVAVAGDTPADQRFSATVDIREDMGSEIFLHFSVPAPPVKSGDVEAALEHETLEALKAEATRHGTPFIARADRFSKAREGERIELAVDTRHLHFFDLESGLGIYEGSSAPAAAPLEAVAD